MDIKPPRFKILVLAPFHTDTEAIWQKPLISVERSTLDDAIRQLEIHHYLPLEADLCPAGGIDFVFNNLKAFHPDGLMTDQPYLSTVNAAKEAIATARKQGKTVSETQAILRQWPDLPRVDIPNIIPFPKKKSYPDGIDGILEMVALPDQQSLPPKKTARNPMDGVAESILQILFRDPGYRRMEAAWRGLRLLLQQGLIENGVAVDIAPVHPQTLKHTIDSITPEVMKELPGLILLDLPFSNTPAAMELLSAAAQWASNLMTPLITWAAADFLHIDSWTDLRKLAYLPTHLEKPEYAKFRAIKTSTGGRWLCLAGNRFMVRYPYGPDNTPRRVAFTEPMLPWISPVWACGTLIAKSCSKTGWPTQLCDKNDYLIEDLAFQSEQQAIPTEVLWDRDRLDQLLRAGITPLVSMHKRDSLFLHNAVTIDGESLAYQLLLSQITRLVLWCKDHLPAETNPERLRLQLKLAFQIFSEQSRPQGFDNVDIAVSQPDREGALPIHITVIPSAPVLSSRRPVELSLNW